MNKIKFVCALSLMMLALNTGCSDSGSKPDNPPGPVDPVDPPHKEVADISFEISSSSACALHTDCKTGSFCFHGICTVECDNDELQCGDGYHCLASRGICVNSDYLSELTNLEKKITNAGEDLSEIEANLLRTKLENRVDKFADFSKSIVGSNDLSGNTVEISNLDLSRVNSMIYEGENVAQFVSGKDYGPIYYAVKSTSSAFPVLKKATAKQFLNHSYHYDFDVDAASILKKNNMFRDNTTHAQVAEIVTSAGNLDVTVSPEQVVSGLFRGYVNPNDILSGISLPIRMAVDVVPSNAKSFDEIEALTVYFPVSSADIFSPENVSFDNANKPIETWAKVEIKQKDIASNCQNKTACFATVFSTNDFAPFGSVLFDKSSRVNRNLRLEFSDFDARSRTFYGTVIDRLEGLYRESSFDISKPENIKKEWNKTSMIGSFSVSKIDEFVVDEHNIHNYTASADNTEIRSLEDVPVKVCASDDYKKLHELMTSGYEIPLAGCDSLDGNEKVICESYSMCDDAEDLADFEMLSASQQLFCLNRAAKRISEDDTRLFAVLQKVLAADSSSQKVSIEVCNKEITNFDDFSQTCLTSECDLCADHPEYVCAADLFSRIYLTEKSLTGEQRADILNNWSSLVNESTLSYQYMSWNKDTEIRKSWLEGAVYDNSFAASIMDNFNRSLLERYRTEVLDVHRGIMGRQFMQTTLEMLSQSLVDESGNEVTALSSARNGILSQLGDAWQNVSESLGLSARRYDVLSQVDIERAQTAEELRHYLFDLYLAGMIESGLNLKADQGSLNAAYGTNLTDVMMKLDSLDQPFEALVFMRDGEIFKDTRLLTEKGQTALGAVKDEALQSISKAVEKRESVFTDMQKRKESVLSINDNYLSSLEKLRSEIVNICGYPLDCQNNIDTCKIYTAPYFCGFALASNSEPGDPLAENDSKGKKISISQVSDVNECFLKKLAEGASKTTDTLSLCLGGDLSLNGDNVSYTTSANVSLAGVAIQEFRIADRDYQTALSEYDVMRSKLQNTSATLQGYADTLLQLNEKNVKLIDVIKDNLSLMSDYQSEIVAAAKETAAETAKTAKQKADLQAKAIKDWYVMNSEKTTFDIGASIIGGVFGIQQMSLNLNTQAGVFDTIYYGAKNIVYNDSNLNLDRLPLVVINVSNTETKITSNSVIATNAKLSAINIAEEVAAAGFSFGVGLNDKLTSSELADLADKHKKVIKAIKQVVDDKELSGDEISEAISVLEADNENLLVAAEQQDTYSKQVAEFELQRTEYMNSVLDLIRLYSNVLSKDISRELALKHYLNVCEQAEMLASQYDSKAARYRDNRDLLMSASSFFQYASDLESVEKYIEYARNDLSDYLAAIEYMTVRPFVELRRALYMARGTNELRAIYEKLNDLTDNCGSGKQSSNTVVVSLKNRLNIASTEFNHQSSDVRLQEMMSIGTIPVSSQIRYSVAGSVGKVLKGDYYSGTFTLTDKFANISNSCNAKIDEIKVRMVSKSGREIVSSGDYNPMISIFYGGQSQLLSCHEKIDAIVASIGSRTSYGRYSTFVSKPFADGLVASIYEVPKDTEYAMNDKTEFVGGTSYTDMRGYPLMATYSIVFDPNAGENSRIEWDNVADIEIQFKYTTGSLGQNSDACKYDIE